ncbi:alpha/beta hydrolase family protein [Nonomuraea sp. NPDC048826]|uniref:alpha/beta hydrolase family protein n=1 Tax=Nonomuraea sp. NPDC048826 TaxID=3364347 RepID=UPI0037110811
MPGAILTRISFSFAADGRHAACLARQDDGPLRVERWSFTGPAPRRATLDGGRSIWTQLLTLTDGRILFTRPGAGHNRLVLAEPAADGLAERTLLTIDCPSVRLIASPDSRALALAVGTADERSAIWRIPGDGSAPERTAELPGLLTGGHPLAGGGLGFNQRLDGMVRPIALDPRTGAVTPLPGTAPGQHLLLSAPGTGRLILAGTAGQRLRLGHAEAGQPRFPGVLDEIDGSVAPMAADPTGEDVALRVNHGARSRLMVYTPRRERIREIPIPPGVIGHACAWGARGLRFPFSSPSRPGGIATVDPATGRWETTPADDDHAWADARAESFAGPDGPIEAVVYGDPRRARRLLISLHGGPEAATQLGFDPFMQAMAGAGIAVVAPNYRGSTGYGAAHQRALTGAWGGPDLADVRELARQLARPGLALMVHGTSYGAYLALLAACADPHLWSHCVAVSPFLSGPRLYEEGAPGVRALLDRLGGRVVIDDRLGPRDVARLCDRITARLLIVHARDDEVIPVGQSRELRARLLSAGRREGRDFVYSEYPTGGHDLLSGQAMESFLRFLLADGPKSPR